MLPGRPVVCRLYSFFDALLPVTTTFSALTTTTKPPMSTDGVYVGLCLPLREQVPVYASDVCWTQLQARVRSEVRQAAPTHMHFSVKKARQHDAVCPSH